QVKREPVSTLLIESKIHLSAGHLPGLANNSIKNDLALGLLERNATQRRKLLGLLSQFPPTNK
ncbi:MAG: hypothetical protein KAQ88_00255, partial [Hyphomicrobiaceae bacterium]|nr:hypothetical protein [Hyphomicrobiaceae bacterium]